MLKAWFDKMLVRFQAKPWARKRLGGKWECWNDGGNPRWIRVPEFALHTGFPPSQGLTTMLASEDHTRKTA